MEGRRAAGAPAPGENGEHPSGAPSFKIIDLIKNLPNLDYINTTEDGDHEDEGHIYFRYHFLD